MRRKIIPVPARIKDIMQISCIDRVELSRMAKAGRLRELPRVGPVVERVILDWIGGKGK